jgi:hypothetical protein
MKQFRVNRKMILWILLLLPFFLPLRADAAWKTKDGRSYYTSGGKRVTGLREIGGKYYYFDTQGIQRTSWRQVGNHYSFFNVGDREKGEMLVSATINGIPIDREGKAVSQPEIRESCGCFSGRACSRTLFSTRGWT